MKLWSDSFSEGSQIRPDFTFLMPHSTQHAALSKNRNPHLAWGDLPPETKTLVLIVQDLDAPASKEFVNKTDKTIPFDFPRVNFFHWVLVDIPIKGSPIQSGEFSKEVTVKGKPGPGGPRGTRQGLNDYTNWFKGNANMEGNYFGYDGPGPAWNDERLHHYTITLFALKEKRCPVEGNFIAQDVINAINNITLAKAKLNYTYSIYPKAR